MSQYSLFSFLTDCWGNCRAPFLVVPDVDEGPTNSVRPWTMQDLNGILTREGEGGIITRVLSRLSCLAAICIRTSLDGLCITGIGKEALYIFWTKIRLLSRSYHQLGDAHLPSKIKSHSSHANALSSVHQAYAQQ